MSNLVLIDNTNSVSVITSNFDSEPSALSLIQDSIIYGQAGSDDCPDGHDCYCEEKLGLMLSSSNNGGKRPHATMDS